MMAIRRCLSLIVVHWKKGMWPFLLSILFVLIVMQSHIVEVGGKTITVDDNGEGDFETIQDAISHSESGDTIRVWEGTYHENVVVSKPLNIVGNGSEETRIDGGGEDDVVFISSDSTYFSGFSISNGSYGIHLDRSSQCSIDNNTFSSNIYTDIWLRRSDRCSIMNNTCTSSNLRGIYLHSSIAFTLENNTMKENGVIIRGSDLENWNSHTIDTTNTVDGKPVHYNKNASGDTVPEGAGQVILANCTSMRVENQIYGNCSVGISAGFCSNITLQNNTCENSFGGISLTASRYCSIMNNTSSNNYDGISISSSNHCSIMNNICNWNDEYGIYLYLSRQCSIVSNTCLGNGAGINADISDNCSFDNNTVSGNINEGMEISSSSDCYVLNNTVKDNNEGIHIYSSSHCSIMYSICEDNEEGIILRYSNNCFIESNICRINTNGIFLKSSSDCEVISNTCSSNNRTGIELNSARDCIIADNNCSSNDWRGIFLTDSPTCILENNTCQNSKDGIGLDYTDTCVLANNTCVNCDIGIHVFTSTSIDIQNNTCSSNGHGITLYRSTDCNLEENTCNSNRYGISILESKESGINTFIHNTCSSNSNSGIYLYESDNNTIMENTCWNNSDLGIYLEVSSYSIITNNICEDNSDSGIYLETSSYCSIMNNTCRNNGDNGILLAYDSSNCTLTNNTCSGNDDGLDLHYVRNCAALNNTIENNTRGIRITHSYECLILGAIVSDNHVGISVHHWSQDVKVHSSDIWSNAEYGINATDNNGNLINATNNWWGDNSGPYHSENNSDGKGDNATDYVDFDPWVIRPRTIYVYDDAPDGGNGSRERPFDEIQAAVNAAADGDIIRVWEGEYHEAVEISKALKIVGNGSESTIIDSGDAMNAVTIESDKVSISNFGITSGFWAGCGIQLESNFNIVRENKFYDCKYGIRALESLNNSILENQYVNCSTGLLLAAVKNYTVFGNNFYSSPHAALLIDNSESVNISQNIMEECGLVLEGDTLKHWNSHSISTSNSVNGDPIYYLKDSNNHEVPTDIGQIILANCSDIDIENLNCTNGSTGLQIGYSRDIRILNNNFHSNNYYGVYLNQTNNCTLSDNNCSSNYYQGIFLTSSHENIITNNSCSSVSDFYDGYGIRLEYSDFNRIGGNNCSSNEYGGIMLKNSDWNTVSDDICNDNRYVGLSSYRSDNNTIRNVTVIENRIDGIRIDNTCDSNVSDSFISGNGVGINLFYNSHYNELFSNTIIHNDIGIRLYGRDQSVHGYCIGNRAHHNEITDNSFYGANASENGNLKLNATHNWWGDSSGPYHLENNTDGKGDNVTDNVDAIPWLKRPNTLYVDDDAAAGEDGSKERPFKWIQDAINASEDGDTIRVFEGIYFESIEVNRSVRLVGNGSEVTTIHGAGNGDVVTITEDRVELSGFTINGSGKWQYGIEIKSDQSHIFDNDFSHNWYGIWLRDSDGHRIEGNTFHSERDGIVATSSDNNHIANNTFSDYAHPGNNPYGINLRDSVNNTLGGNRLDGVSLYLGGRKAVHYSSHHIDTSNVVNGRPIQYFSNVSGSVIPAGAGQVILANCSRMMIEDQNCSGGTLGMLIAFSSNNTVRNNTCVNAEYAGIYLVYSNDNQIENNNLSDSSYGIRIYISHRNDIHNNMCSITDSRPEIFWDGYGVDISSSNHNTISSNVISNHLKGIDLSNSSFNTITGDVCISNGNSGISVDRKSHYNSIFGVTCIAGSHYGMRITGTYISIENSTAKEYEYGIFIENAYTTLRNSTITGNDVGVFTESATTRLKQCEIFNNSRYGVSVGEFIVGEVNATNNWWGDDSGPYHPVENPDGKGDNVTDDVDFDPWIGKGTGEPSLPDLTIGWITTDPVVPFSASKVIISVEVRNEGSMAAESINVSIYQGDYESIVLHDPTPWNFTIIGSIPAQGSVVLDLDWYTPECECQATITVVLDINDDLDEENEENNHGTLSFGVILPGSRAVVVEADLPVIEVEQGKKAVISFSVMNAGAYIDRYEVWATGSIPGEGNWTRVLDLNLSLNPGEGKELELPITSGNSTSFFITVYAVSLLNSEVKDSEVIEIKLTIASEEDDPFPVPIPIPPIIIISIGSGFLFLILIYGTGYGRFAFFSLLYPLYTRLTKRDFERDIQEHTIRGRIYQFIIDNPGSNFSQVLRGVSAGNGTTCYHLKVLERNGFIKSMRKDVNIYYFRTGMRFPYKLQSKLSFTQLEILKALSHNSNRSVSQVAALIDRSVQTTSENIRRLERKKLVTSRMDGPQKVCVLTEKGRDHLTKYMI